MFSETVTDKDGRERLVHAKSEDELKAAVKDVKAQTSLEGPSEGIFSNGPAEKGKVAKEAKVEETPAEEPEAPANE